MKYYIVINSNIDGASVDKDCVFQFKNLAEKKAEALSKEYKNIDFSVCELELPEDKDSALYSIADSISEHADAMRTFAEAVKEFVVCTCTKEAYGKSATHPTIIIKEDK